MADVNDPDTLLHGCLSRFCTQNPPVTSDTLNELGNFVDGWIRIHLQPLPHDTDFDVVSWLETTSYPKYRRDELMRVHEDLGGSLPNTENESHGKRETYLKYKPARGINSRDDQFKVFSGPIFKKIEDVLYHHPSFIKHIAEKNRPQYLVDLFEGCSGPFYQTDYSHFESHFVPKVMRALELRLYKYMLVNFPTAYSVIEKALSGVNVCNFAGFSIRIKGVRMSGDMCTSLGNGFSNLMLFNFVAWKKGGVCKGVVEGDDGLFVSSVPISVSDFADMGFAIKIEEYSDILRASFCGMMMSSDLAHFADPRKTLLNFGWSHSPLMRSSDKVRLGLLRAKALSLLYENPRCPILACLAKTYIDLTDGISPVWCSNWYDNLLRDETNKFSEWAMSEFAKGISNIARSDFADIYDIDVEKQILIEAEISSWPLIGVVHSPLVDSLFGDEYSDCRDYFDRFVTEYGASL